MTETAAPPRAPAAGRGGWTPGRIIALAAGSVLVLAALAGLGAGTLLLWADQTQRADGYLRVGQAEYSTSGYALVSEQIALHGGWEFLEPFVGEARFQVTPALPAKPVFLAIGTSRLVSRFLAHARYTVIARSGMFSHPGHRTPGAPGSAVAWTARASGTGTQTLTWTPDTGDWTVVVMNTDGSAGLSVHASVGISAPMLLRMGIAALLTGMLLGVLAAGFIVAPIRLAAGSGATGDG